MSVFPTNVCGRHDHHTRPQVNPTNHCQSERLKPGRYRPLFPIVSLDFSALLSRRSQVRLLLGRPITEGVNRSHGLHNIPSTWFTLFLPLIRQVRLASKLIYWAIAHLNSLYYNVHNYVQNNGEKMNTLTPIHAGTTISVTDLRKLTPSKIIEQAGGNPVAILSHNKPEAYLLSAKLYETILDALDDLELIKTVEKRRGGKTIRVNLEDL